MPVCPTPSGFTRTFDGVMTTDSGDARAYRFVVIVAADGSWSLDWTWTTGEPAVHRFKGRSFAAQAPILRAIIGLSAPPVPAALRPR